ncbi:hypothetical protein BVY04_01710 [bacterium M21]|nr:hypothetical protein BVY04_01710 [bacterium M21]
MNNTDDKATLLVVDDDQDLLQALSRSLRKERTRWDMTFVDSPEDALTILDGFSVDLLISDVRMSERDGMSLLVEARERCPHLQVILMTGMPDIDAAIEAIKAGAAYYLTKPIDHDKLITVIEDALSHRKQPLSGGQAAGLRQLRTPRLIGGYRIVRPISEGNMGSVFLATKEVDGQPQEFALKLLKLSSSPAEAREAACQRFTREAEIAFQMEHPNIISLCEYGIAMQDQVPYMVMDYFPGVTLDQYISERPRIDHKLCLNILLQLAGALTEVHRHVLCHRDLKAENVLIDGAGHIKLIDFGVAKITNSSLTQTGMVVGTPSYLAPEWLSNQPEVDHRADLFSFGVLAYQFAVGVLPFEADTLPALIRKIVREVPISPTTIEPSVPAGLDRLILRLLAKDPNDRPADACAVADELLLIRSGMQGSEY